MKKFLKKITVILLAFMFLSTGCKKQEVEDTINLDIKPLSEGRSYIGRVEYKGLNIDGLKSVSNYQNDCFGSLSFGEYDDGNISCIRNLDLKWDEYVAYEMIVRSGDNAKYPFWGITYCEDGKDLYLHALENGLEESHYNVLPFMACDTMSFGYTEDGDRSSLYVSSILRYEPNDSTKNVACSGTYPNAKYECSYQSVPSLVSANCITIEQVLAFVGAIDENGNMLFSSINPSLNVSSFSKEKDGIKYDVLPAFALEDSSGRHGVLEYIDNKAIWHEGCDYCFNYFLQNDYLLNDDGTYKEKWGKGIGRCNAISSSLGSIHSMEDHLKLMNDIEIFSVNNNTIDWRSEFSDFDVFKNYDNCIKMNLDTKNADDTFPLYAHYYDKELETIVFVNSYDTWLDNKDHLDNIYDLNYCMNEDNKNEISNLYNWLLSFKNGLNSNDYIKIDNIYLTYFKVIADPMNYRVTRWFNEEVTTADTIYFDDVCDYLFIKEE